MREINENGGGTRRCIQVQSRLSTDFLVLEGIKTLRSNLMFSGVDKRIIGITSCNAGEGKSTVSFQLAASFAQLNRRVLLLDVDLRKSAAANRYGFLKTDMGISHYLSGMAPLDRVCYATDIPGLYMAPAGKLVPNALELLASQRFQELLPVLRREFDYVIVDTPPLGQVIDCAVIAADLDGVVMLIDATRNSCKAEKRIRDQIGQAGGKVLGVVLNRVDFTDKFGYYGKKRYGKYAYGQ